MHLRQAICLVTGATGAIGPAVIATLNKAGYRIRTLSLDPPQPGLIPETADVRTGDVTDPSTVEAAVRDCAIVLHLAALLHIVDAPPDLFNKYERINVHGTRTVVDASLRARVSRLVLFSTIAVYGNSRDNILDEDSPTRPETPYAKTKLAAERLVMEAKRADGQALGTVLRLAAVYGARVKGNYRRLVHSLARRRFLPVGSGRNRRTLVHENDVGKAGVLAAVHPLAAGKIFNVTDGQFHTMGELIRVICGALGRKPPRISLPVEPVRWTVGAAEVVGHMLGLTSPIKLGTIDKYVEDLAVSGRRIQEELGFVPDFGIREGWEKTVSEMRRLGEI